jgi:hypothetical protein
VTTSSAEPARLEAYPNVLTAPDEQLSTLAVDVDRAMSAFVAGAGAYLPGTLDQAYAGTLVRGLHDESRYLAGWVADVGLAFREADGDPDGDGIFSADDGFLALRVGPPTMAEAMVIPPAGSDPAAVARWWANLPPELRERLIEENFPQLGMLRGLPAPDIDRINRLRLDQDIEVLSGDLADVNAAINGQMHTPSGQVDPDLYLRRDRLLAELGNARKIEAQMHELDGDSPPGPQPYLLTYSYQDAGRFAVALGNPDTADNTAVVVPGTSHDVRNEGGGLFGPVAQGQVLYDEMNQQSGSGPYATGPGASNSVIVWMGADMPDAIPNAMNPTYGDIDHGADWLRDDVAGYQAAHTQANVGNTRNPADDHMTVVAHSYGSHMSGQAVKGGMNVDDFVNIGSAGLPADNAGELGMANEHVWAGNTDDDIVPDMQWLGRDPAEEEFGATVFATEDSSGHSEYYNEGSQSLENMARIAVGRYDDVERRPPD